MYTENNVEFTDFCGGMTKDFTTTGQLFVKEGTSLVLMCKFQSNLVSWAYLDTVDLFIAASGPVTTKDGAVTFSSDGAIEGCLSTRATIPNVDALIGTPLSCLTDDDENPTVNSTVIVRHAGQSV